MHRSRRFPKRAHNWGSHDTSDSTLAELTSRFSTLAKQVIRDWRRTAGYLYIWGVPQPRRILPVLFDGISLLDRRRARVDGTRDGSASDWRRVGRRVAPHA